jgi:hypothetical protein
MVEIIAVVLKLLTPIITSLISEWMKSPAREIHVSATDSKMSTGRLPTGGFYGLHDRGEGEE